MSSSSRNCEIVRRFAEVAWGDANLNIVDELVSPDAIPPDGIDGGFGPEAFKRRILLFRAALSEFDTSIDEVFGEGDMVAIRFTTSGRHTGDLLGVAPTGQMLTVRGIGMARVEGGKIVQQWGENNLLSVIGRPA